MKPNYHRIRCSALAAGGLATAGLPVTAAEETTSHDSSEAWRTESFRTDRTLGHVERADKLIGREVLTSDNQRFGRIDNLVVELDRGRILYAVIGSGGFLGAGEQRVAVPPMVFTQVTADNSPLQLSLDKQKLTSAPKFTPEMDNETQLANADFVTQVYRYCGQKAWWHGGTAGDIGSFRNVHQASALTGMRIENTTNEKLGKVDSVALDLPTGRLVYLILSPDHSLNLGDNLYALPPSAFTWNAHQRALIADINQEKLAAAPHFEKDHQASLSDPAWAARVYQYYGKRAYFEKDGLQITSGSDEPTPVFPKKD